LHTLLLEAARAGHSLRRRLLEQTLEEGAGTDFWHRIWHETASEVGASIADLGDGFFEIERASARTRVRRHYVMLDDPVTLQLAGNKPAVHRLLRAAGVPVPDFVPFTLAELDIAAKFARSSAGPCVVKPARGTGGGRGVTTHVCTRREIRRAALHASLFCRELVIESQIPGDVYRLLYLDGKLLDAVRRRPPYVVGDGISTVRELIAAENRRRGERSVRGVSIDIDTRAALRRSGCSLRSVPASGCRVPITGISNAGSELDSECVLEQIGKDLEAEAACAAEAVGCRLAGVDVITIDPASSLREVGGCVNEVNTTPGLQWHYQIRNPEQGVRVAALLLESLLV